ncbi:MAG: hypothetical protein F6J87_17710 [Spirulina sp. SIO3F2]|nr:hypothetical protein [Spirulina sp. SIO3F2]
MQFYEDSLKEYRNLQNSLDTVHRKGKVEGLAEVVKKGIEQGLSDELLVTLAGLTVEEIQRMRLS